MKWKVLESTYLHKEPWLTVRKDKCELPNGTIIPSFYVSEYDEWANAFALTKEGQVVMVKQYRHGIGSVEIELPGGVVEAGEDLQEGVERELLEETGYRFEKFEYLGRICANPSTTNNFMHMYLATGGEKIADQHLDEVEEVKSLVRNNQMMQSLHVNCILYALLKLGEIKL
jgi:ADP-ribose pyrophosphatase YjhB (NUDIX family)